MPTYHARNITVRLGSVPLAETITSDIALRKGEKAKRQSELAENKLLHSRFLQEKRLQFPGVTDDFELNWLGNAPFMQVVADNGTALPSELTGNAPQDRVAQALALHVELSDKAFHSGFVGKTHLKIEVLFNGQLSACSLTHSNDIRSGAKPLHQVFAGYRIDFLAERPWVLLPSFMTADGGTRRFHKTITPLERFSEISAALRKEAAERGTDKQGAPPPSARFIDALARMQAPASVANLQKPGGKKFGVVDVIITAGTGNKLTTGTNYLKTPQKLKDFDYAVRTEIESELEDISHSARARVDEVRSTVDRLQRNLRLQSNNACPDTEDNIDLLDESPCKRRALSPAEGSSQHAAQKIDFQVPFLGAKHETTLQYHVSSTAGGFSQRCTTPKYRADGCKKPLPCSDGDHAYQIAHDLPQMLDYIDTAARGFHRFQSSPAVSYSSTPQSLLMPPTLAGMPSSDSVTEVRMPNASTPPSKTLDAAHDHIEGDLSFSKPVWCGGNDPSTLVDPYVAPTAWMLPVATSWQSSLIPMGSPHFHPGYVAQPATPKTYTRSGHLNGLPILGPQARFFYSQPGHTPPMLPTSLLSPVVQRSGPLPPTAMFSVPSKPRSNASARKNLAATEYAEPGTDVLVKRLVITDLDGKSIIDHHWSTPQYIVGNRCISTGGTRIATSTVHSREGKDIKDTRTNTNRQSMLEQRQDSLQDGQVGSLTELPLPYLKRHQGPFDSFAVANPQIDVPDNIAPFVSTPMLTTTPQTKCSHSIQAAAPLLPTESTVLPRRVLQRHAVPSIQGPKAATFLYDDPEDVLREAARIRRSKSSKERPAKVPTPLSALPAQPSVTSDRDRQGGSSPLSSAPSSPLLNSITEAVGTVSLPPSHTSQLDGCFETALPTTPLKNPSPHKLTTSKLRLQRLAPATPQSSVSPGLKKRKWPVKVPRSPDRLMTVRNPPLNDDCVIAFAESADKNEKRGILRQVRGERQGVFKEDYVMLAVRFYIAGG